MLSNEILLEVNETIDISELKKMDTLNGTLYDEVEEFEQNLPPTVTLLETEFGSKVYIVGTAHFSKESQEDVSFVIRNVKPDVVMVELCPSRIHMLYYDEKTLLEEARDISLTKIHSITKSNGLLNGLFYILMLNMSAKLTRDLGMAPGI
ncbi:traB domain-containing protein-like [Contarinia nasturtii]|uniref:traB domain-containing protein-like n=1 Tax=Contarinia nasturtii TaxID=265458 RepID=UPI0012D42894|nr:traB domain-containing protein-like [Contarinia nasturtii]